MTMYEHYEELFTVIVEINTSFTGSTPTFSQVHIIIWMCEKPKFVSLKRSQF